MAKLAIGIRCYMCKTCGRMIPDTYRCWLHSKARAMSRTAHNKFWGPDGEDYDPTADPYYAEELQKLAREVG